MIGRRKKITAAVAVSMLVLAACGGDDEAADTTSAPAVTEAPADTEAPVDTEAPADTEAPVETEAPEPEGWAVNTDDCVDPDAANAPIEGTLKIGSAMPLTGGVAAAAFAPVKAGFEAYIQYANEKGLVPGLTLEVSIADDQYNPELTPGAVTSEIDAGAHIFAGIIGTGNNAAVQETLNNECIPQLNALTGSPQWGDPENYPWTTGLLPRYDAEAAIYAKHIADNFGEGATVGLFTVNNEFGAVYAEAFVEAAEANGLEIVSEQTIEATDSNPPTSQVTTIAGEQPDAIMAIPLGAGCIGFLTEVANAKAQNAGWTPATYLTNTCASSLILGAAGPAADGLLTTGYLLDILDPANQTPAVVEYREFMKALGNEAIETTAAAGWLTGEVTVEIIRRAAESAEGLTRASIINAARSFEYSPTLGRVGLVMKSMGAEDPFLVESLTVIQYNATTALFTDQGELITEFES